MSTLNQTLQEKFPHLEVSVLKLSEVQRDNETKRIDSEYFKKEYLENEEFLKNLSVDCEDLGNLIIKMTGGATPLGADYPENGISFLRVQNIMQNYFNLNDIVYINSKDDEILKRSRLKLNDVLLTITGAYGKAAVVENDLVGANINQHSVKIEVKNINPYFLSTFLNSKFGQLQCDKKITGVTRPALDYQVIKTFLIPLLPMSFQLEIEKLVKDSHLALEQSKVLYKQAEELLYTELGLNPQNPLQSILQSHSNNINFRIATLKESFLKTGRLDSEYYQVKYEKFEALIKNYKNGWDCVKTFFSQNNTSCNFSKSEYKYIEIGDINTNSGIASYNTIQTNELPANAKMAVAKDDILISKVRPYRGAVAIIDFKAQDIVASGAFAVLREKGNFKKEVLQVLLRTSIYKEWLLKWNVGTSYPVIKDEDILNLPIPKIDLQTQDSIASHIQQSFTLRAEAKALLNEAKAKVESAISGGGGG